VLYVRLKYTWTLCWLTIFFLLLFWLTGIINTFECFGTKTIIDNYVSDDLLMEIGLHENPKVEQLCGLNALALLSYVIEDSSHLSGSCP